MLYSILEKYKKYKIKIISRLGNGELGLLGETSLLEDTIIENRISILQREANLIVDEINNCEKEEQDKLEFLINRKKECSTEIGILASNKLEHLDMAIKMIDDKSEIFICMEGLKAFKEGKRKLAKEYFDSFFRENKYLLNHFLISKIYGELLFENKEFNKASYFFRKAVELSPTNLEIHYKLLEIYKHVGEKILLKNEEEIISILGGMNGENCIL